MADNRKLSRLVQLVAQQVHSNEMIAVQTFLSLSIICVNIIELMVLFRRRGNPTNHERFIFSLAAADLLTGLGLSLIVATGIFNHEISISVVIILYQVAVSVIFHSLAVLLLTMVAIAFDRFLCVNWPFFYRTRCQRKYALKIIFLIWVPAMAIPALPEIFMYFKETEIILIVTTVFFLATPCTAILAFYSGMAVKLLIQAKRVLKISSSDSMKQSDKQVFTMCCAITTSFFVCTIPYLVKVLTGNPRAAVESQILFFNSLVNPTLFFVNYFLCRRVPRR